MFENFTCGEHNFKCGESFRRASLLGLEDFAFSFGDGEMDMDRAVCGLTVCDSTVDFPFDLFRLFFLFVLIKLASLFELVLMELFGLLLVLLDLSRLEL